MTFGQESHNRWFTDCYLRLQWYLFPGLFCYEENDGNSFLLAANSDIATQDTLEMSAVPLDRVIKILSSVKAQHLLTVIDACRNNPETGSSSENNALTDDFLHKPQDSMHGGDIQCFLSGRCYSSHNSWH